MAHSHQASAHSHHGQGGSNLRTSAQATLHCLTGCVIGEVAGLLIGVSAAVSWANDAVEVKARAAAIAVMAFVGCSILWVMTDQPAAAAVRRAVSDGPGLAYDKRNARPLT